VKFLDELEQKAQQQRDSQVEQAAMRETQISNFEEHLAPAMRSIFEYLKKLTEHLNFVESREPFQYSIPGYGKVNANLSPDLKCLYSSAEDHISICITGTAEVPEQREVQIIGDKKVAEMRNFIREHGLSGEDKIQRAPNGTTVAAEYRLRGKINVLINIHASFDKNEIVLEFINHKDFGRNIRVLHAEEINGELTDKLGRYIAGVDEEFIKHDIPLKVRNQLRRQIELEKAKSDLELRQQERKLKAQLVEEDEQTSVNKLPNMIMNTFRSLSKRKPWKPSVICICSSFKTFYWAFL